MRPLFIQMSKLLIFSNSYDSTTDLLLDRLDDSSVLRLNFDQITGFRFRLNTNGFELGDASGRTIKSNEIRKAY